MEDVYDEVTKTYCLTPFAVHQEGTSAEIRPIGMR